MFTDFAFLIFIVCLFCRFENKILNKNLRNICRKKRINQFSYLFLH